MASCSKEEYGNKSTTESLFLVMDESNLNLARNIFRHGIQLTTTQSAMSYSNDLNANSQSKALRRISEGFYLHISTRSLSAKRYSTARLVTAINTTLNWL